MPVSGNASDAFGVATIAWHARASSTPPPSARPCRRATTGLAHVSMARRSAWPRRVNVCDASIVPVLDVSDEIADVGAGDERLAAPGDDDAPHVPDRRPRRGTARLELRDDGFVQRVHGVGAVDRQRGDAVGDLGAHEA